MTFDKATRWLTTNTMPTVPFVNRLRVSGFRSFAECDVTFGPLTVLIGRNASGKSNLLDALKFIRDCVESRPLKAVTARGGTDVLFHQANAETAEALSVEVYLTLRSSEGDSPSPGPVHAMYGFRLVRDAVRSRQLVAVESEWLEVRTPEHGTPRGFRREGDTVTPLDGDAPLGPVMSTDQGLWLGLAAATDATYAGVLHALSTMSLYAPVPARIAEPQRATSGDTLLPDASNLGQILGTLATAHPEVKQRIDDYLAAIVPGAIGIDERPLDAYSSVQLRMRDDDTADIIRFGADQLSYGTLRAAGLLAALFQPDALEGWTSLVCVDEPELGLHPAAAGVMFDALTEAAKHVQVIVATQSGDLLDRDEFDPDWVRTVTVVDGATVIEPLGEVARRVLAKGLDTIGGLMRGDQLTPNEVWPESGPRP
ncbi:AAA family ATPase [Streptomyces sp. NPDC047042]|uniref:AAA family ATPase n=1 Tax=Streptomyces sp. NPDC047042 TaxID=3154807 RepID=UPI0034063C52